MTRKQTTLFYFLALGGGVLGAPISTIVIVFELTAALGLIVAVMITATVSAAHKLLPGGSFFTWQARRRGMRLGDG